NRSGLRPALMDAGLRDELDAYISARAAARPEAVLTTLGGAAGNMGYVLRELGLPVAVHWPYHAEAIAGLCPDCLQYMALGAGMSFQDAEQGFPAHPKRRSIIFSYSPAAALNPAPTNPIQLSWRPAKI